MKHLGFDRIHVGLPLFLLCIKLSNALDDVNHIRDNVLVKNDSGTLSIIWSGVGCLCALFGLAFSVFMADKRKKLALKGDEKAGERIILPCYKPLYRSLIATFFIISATLFLTLVGNFTLKDQFHIVQFYCLALMTIYGIAPVLLMQRAGVTRRAFWNTFYIISSWWTSNILVWVVVIVFQDHPVVSYTLELIFSFTSSLPPFLFSVGLLTKIIPSRIQIGSRSNRASTEFLLLYSVVFFIANICSAVALSSEAVESNLVVIMEGLAGGSFIWNLFFPLSFYRTLLADTKFWRGVGKHNVGGLGGRPLSVAVKPEDLESGNSDESPRKLSMTSIDLKVVSSHFQDMMSNISDRLIDFAFMQIDEKIGEGASSTVYKGSCYSRKMKREVKVAIKAIQPPELTTEVIEVFVDETKITSTLNHRNIVKFHGICIRPPQIAMVIELCEEGDLKSSLEKKPELWTPVRRLKACLDAAKALQYLHGKGFIHRDLKTENFFVSKDWVVKLGDFGETTKKRTVEEVDNSATKRMSIVGTVAYMAPEIIKVGTTHYTDAIDVYALGLTFWEIWTGRDPYERLTTFKIYKKVGEGRRPEIPADAPADFIEVMTGAWHQDAETRLTATECVIKLTEVLRNYRATHGLPEENDDSPDEIIRSKKSSMRVMSKKASSFFNKGNSFFGKASDMNSPMSDVGGSTPTKDPSREMNSTLTPTSPTSATGKSVRTLSFTRSPMLGDANPTTPTTPSSSSSSSSTSTATVVPFSSSMRDEHE